MSECACVCACVYECVCFVQWPALRNILLPVLIAGELQTSHRFSRHRWVNVWTLRSEQQERQDFLRMSGFHGWCSAVRYSSGSRMGARCSTEFGLRSDPRKGNVGKGTIPALDPPHTGLSGGGRESPSPWIHQRSTGRKLAVSVRLELQECL